MITIDTRNITPTLIDDSIKSILSGLDAENVSNLVETFGDSDTAVAIEHELHCLITKQHGIELFQLGLALGFLLAEEMAEQ